MPLWWADLHQLGGVLEKYQLSDAMAAAEFTDAFHAYQAALSAG